MYICIRTGVATVLGFRTYIYVRKSERGNNMLSACKFYIKISTLAIWNNVNIIKVRKIPELLFLLCPWQGVSVAVSLSDTAIELKLDSIFIDGIYKAGHVSPLRLRATG